MARGAMKKIVMDLVWFAGANQRAGFHSAKALLSGPRTGLHWGFVTNEAHPDSTRSYG